LKDYCGNMTMDWTILYTLKFTRTNPVLNDTDVSKYQLRATASYGGDRNVRNQIFADVKNDPVLHSRLAGTCCRTEKYALVIDVW